MESMARVFHAMGEPMRLRLLNALSAGDRSVNELVAATGTGQPNVSKHLSVLINAGMLRRRKEGVKVCYSLAGEMPLELVSLMEAADSRIAKHRDNLTIRSAPRSPRKDL
jgi:DNA-binding transcriptional ArsR family regulator